MSKVRLSYSPTNTTLNSEQVEQGSCADPGIFVRWGGGGGGGGGGGVEARRPENSLDNVFLVSNLFYSL